MHISCQNQTAEKTQVIILSSVPFALPGKGILKLYYFDLLMMFHKQEAEKQAQLNSWAEMWVAASSLYNPMYSHEVPPAHDDLKMKMHFQIIRLYILLSTGPSRARWSVFRAMIYTTTLASPVPSSAQVWPRLLHLHLKWSGPDLNLRCNVIIALNMLSVSHDAEKSCASRVFELPEWCPMTQSGMQTALQSTANCS